MIHVQCDGCAAPYPIEERRVPPGGLKIRCTKCGKSLVVTKDGLAGGSLEDLPAPAAPRPAAKPPLPPRPGAPAPPPATRDVTTKRDLPAQGDVTDLPAVPVDKPRIAQQKAATLPFGPGAATGGAPPPPPPAERPAV